MIDEGLIDGFERVNYAGGYGFKAIELRLTIKVMELLSNNNIYDDFINRLEECASKPDNTVFADCDIKGMSNFYKYDKTSKVWWVERLDSVGELLFSFDRKKIYNLFSDYPHNLSKEEVEIFDK